MATLRLGSNFNVINPLERARMNSRSATICLPFCRQNHNDAVRSNSNLTEKKEKETGSSSKQGLPSSLGSIIKVGKDLKESMSPKRKGDWRDVMLMSLSFAVYVYMSQKIVCAYCAWVSILKQPW